MITEQEHARLDTVKSVLSHLAALPLSKTPRVRLLLGNTATGKSWNEENETIGLVSRSLGPQKVYILLPMLRSTSGGAIMEHCILGILALKPRRWLYKADNYIPSKVEAKALDVEINGELFAVCATEQKAKDLAAFMRLDRHKR